MQAAALTDHNPDPIMFQACIAVVTALIALALGALQARAQVLHFALATASERSGIASLTNLVTLAAWALTVAWVFASWSWYWAVLAVIAALAASQWLRPSSITVWTSLRYLIAMATLASAGLLWTVFHPGAAS